MNETINFPNPKSSEALCPTLTFCAKAEIPHYSKTAGN